MKQYSNWYIFRFSIIMVVIVATILAIVATMLRKKQEQNIRIEQMKNILASVHIEATAKNVEALFNKYITDNFVVNYKGNKIEGVEAFDIDLKKQAESIQQISEVNRSMSDTVVSPFKKFISGQSVSQEINIAGIKNKIEDARRKIKLPVYVCQNNGGIYYVFALRGKGLWGPIWGYISLKNDLNTIYGTYFDHKSETPGLGAEINTLEFQKQFINKTIYNIQNKFVSVKVSKVKTTETNKHTVDAISGGTITSKGLEVMIFDFLLAYKNFIEKNKK